MHMLSKSGLLSQTGWENMAKTFSKCSKMVKFWTLNTKFKGFTSSYGAETKFIRNTGQYGISDMDSSS